MALAMHGCMGSKEAFTELLRERGIDTVLEPTMKAASTGSRLSTITTRRCTTVPGWEKNFPPTCSRNYSALRKMPSCRKPPCSARICSRSAPVTWRVPSSRSSACFLSMPTVLTRKRKPSRECCKRRKRKNAVHAAFETRLFIQLNLRLCNKKTTFADWPRQWSSCGPYPSCFSDSCVLVLLSGIFRHGYLHRNCG